MTIQKDLFKNYALIELVKMSAVSASRALPTVAIASTLPGVATAILDALKHAGLNSSVNVKVVNMESDTFDDLLDASIVVGEPKVFCSKALVEKHRTPRLTWFMSTFAGVEALVDQAGKENGRNDFTVTRAGGSMGVEIGQYVLGYVFSHERKHSLCEKAQSDRDWAHDAALYRPLSSVSLGILGLGDIGKDIARLAKGVGFGTVYGWKRSGERVDFVDATFTDHVPVLEKSDYIVSVLPSTTSTRGFLDNGALACCSQKSPVFINVGRGDLLSEDSIIEALENGWISHAILDVFPTEPLPTTSKLWTSPHCTITPHVSGMSHPENIAKLFCKNLQQYLEKQYDNLEYKLDWGRGY